MKRCISILLFIGGLLPCAAQDSQEPSSGFRAEFLLQMNDVQSKILELANAVPQEKYLWRPSENVRSVSEVYMHIAGGNFFLPTMAGVKAPEGYSRDMEQTVTDKAKLLTILKQSFEHLRRAILSISDADLDKPAKWFGQETTVRGIFFNIANHMHEHLGQSIAYARMNGIVPPWTAREEAKKKEKK